jgi:mono/diheme cytochrome c family protein
MRRSGLTVACLLGLSVLGCDGSSPVPMAETARAPRPPPEGTVPREQRTELVLLDWKDEAGNFRSTFPVGLKVDEAFVRRGQRRYGSACASCHGVKADGAAAGKQPAPQATPSLVAPDSLAVGYLFEVMTAGRGQMASMAGALSITDRWAVAAYVRALQLSRVPLEALTSEEQRELLLRKAGGTATAETTVEAQRASLERFEWADRERNRAQMPLARGIHRLLAGEGQR